MYKNGLTWIRIEAPDRFTEVRKIGSRYEQHQYVAKILPDRNHIADLTLHYSDFAVEIPASDFEKVLELTSK